MKQVSHNIKNKYNIAKSAYQTYKAAQKMQKDQQKKNQDGPQSNEPEEEKKEEMKDMDENDIKNVAESGIDVMWNITVFDVEKTLRAAIDKIFRDKSVDQ